MSGSIRCLSSRIAYENPWIRVREDRIRRPTDPAGAAPGLYAVVEKAPFAIVLPIHEDGRIELVEQFRYPLGARCWELPQGSLPAGAEAAPDVIAARELREETGLEARRLVSLGTFHAMAGLTDQVYTGFVATELSRGARALEETEADLVSAAFPPGDVAAMIRDGRLADSHSIAVLGLAALSGHLPDFALAS